jgi:uncharacterized protein (DUF1330 family)
MAGYLVVTMHSISDPEKIQEYRVKAGPTVEKYGGVAIIHPRGKQDFVEGEKAAGIIVYKFPSYDNAVTWYNSPEYREAMELRMGAVDVQIVLAEGLD